MFSIDLIEYLSAFKVLCDIDEHKYLNISSSVFYITTFILWGFILRHEFSEKNTKYMIIYDFPNRGGKSWSRDIWNQKKVAWTE